MGLTAYSAERAAVSQAALPADFLQQPPAAPALSGTHELMVVDAAELDDQIRLAVPRAPSGALA
jgi:hypothetical protein